MIYVSRVTSLTYAKLGGGGGWKFFGVSRAAYTIWRFMHIMPILFYVLGIH